MRFIVFSCWKHRAVCRRADRQKILCFSMSEVGAMRSYVTTGRPSACFRSLYLQVLVPTGDFDFRLTTNDKGTLAIVGQSEVRFVNGTTAQANGNNERKQTCSNIYRRFPFPRLYFNFVPFFASFQLKQKSIH